MDVYMGLIFPSALNFAPNYTDNCYGQAYNISSNSALYSLLGTTFGGNGTVTFGIPDLRGRVPVGIGVGGVNTSNIVLGAVGGSSSTTLLSANLPPHTHPATFSAITGSSPITITVGSGGSTTSLNANVAEGTLTNGTLTVSTVLGNASTPANNALPAGAQAPAAGPTAPARTVNAYGPITTGSTAAWPVTGTIPAQTAPVTGTISGNASMVTGGSVTVQPNSGASAPISNMQPYIGINYLIITQGLYPTRP